MNRDETNDQTDMIYTLTESLLLSCWVHVCSTTPCWAHEPETNPLWMDADWRMNALEQEHAPQ